MDKFEYRYTPAFAIDNYTVPVYYADEKLFFSYDFAGSTHIVGVDEPGYYDRHGTKVSPVFVEGLDCIFPMLKKDADRFVKKMQEVGETMSIAE